MLLDFIHDLFPYTIIPSLPFADIEIGQIFIDNGVKYKLLYRDAIKVEIVRWNWWTKLWWRNKE